MPSQFPLVLGTETLSHTQLACPGEHPPYPSMQDSSAPLDPWSPSDSQVFLSHTGSRRTIQTRLQPGHPQVLQTCYSTQHPCPGHHPAPLTAQPRAGDPVPTVSATVEGEEGDKGEGGGKRHCGICGHLLLAVLLAVCSPLVAVGVCVADVVTGECCNVQGKHIESVDDLM